MGDGTDMFKCRTLKVFGIDFTFQSLLYNFSPVKDI